MALNKKIELENGVILNYHRINSMNKVTNILNSIEVNSYINEKQRLKEKKYQELQQKNAKGEELTEEEKQEIENGIDVLIIADYIEKEYDQNEGIEEAYEYLKTLDKYKNAENY